MKPRSKRSKKDTLSRLNSGSGAWAIQSSSPAGPEKNPSRLMVMVRTRLAMAVSCLGRPGGWLAAYPGRSAAGDGCGQVPDLLAPACGDERERGAERDGHRDSAAVQLRGVGHGREREERGQHDLSCPPQRVRAAAGAGSGAGGDGCGVHDLLPFLMAGSEGSCSASGQEARP